MDKLKDFIASNRAGFEEVHLNEDQIWDNIQKRNNRSRSPRTYIMKVAAVGILLVGMGFFLGQFQIRKQTNSIMSTIEQKELYRLDHFYGNLLADQVNLIQESNTISRAEKDEIFMLIDQMELDYTELKKELENNINSDYIIDEIITNYKNRLQLLERLNSRVPSINENSNEQYINL